MCFFHVINLIFPFLKENLAVYLPHIISLKYLKIHMTHFSVDEILNLPDNKKRETLEKLLAELENLKGKDKYGLYWDLNATTEGEETVIKECQTFFPVLDAIADADGLKHLTQFAPPQSDLFDKPDKPQPTHLLIEGDNYHALNALLYTHRKAVDLIYIDPPYNTGNKDFRYNDNFIDKENGGRHTLWLSFMKSRLELAKELLKDTGVIFISIDDNEQAQLKLLCDRVFKEENFVANVIWQKKYSPQNDDKGITAIHEYLLVFAKKKLVWRPYLLERTELALSRYKDVDNDPRGLWKSGDLTSKTKANGHSYPITSPTGKIHYPSVGRQWAPSLDTFNRWLSENRIWFGKDGNSVPQIKQFLSEVQKGTVPMSLWSRDEVGDNQEAARELKFHSFNFDTPKPVRLINRILKLTTNKDTPSVILDFFAGSGTTGHAVLELNKQDGGRRQFILVTNNEVTDKTKKQLRKEGKTEAEIEALGICRSVTYPRLQKVIEGYTTPKGEQVPGTGGRLRYYRTEYVERSPNFDQQAYNFKGKCTEMLCIKENIFTPLADSNDKPYDAEGWEVYQDYDKTLAVLHDDTPQYRADLTAVLAQQMGQKVLYIFGIGSGISLEEYKTYFGKDIKIEPMPTEIMNLYKRRFDRKKK